MFIHVQYMYMYIHVQKDFKLEELTLFIRHREMFMRSCQVKKKMQSVLKYHVHEHTHIYKSMKNG